MSERKKQPNRRRDKHLHFCVNEEEYKLIQDRMARLGVTGMGAYMRKMAIDGYHVSIDLTEIKEMVRQLRSVSNNMNQIAKRVNETNNIYTSDIEDLRQRYDSLWDAARKILQGLAKIK